MIIQGNDWNFYKNPILGGVFNEAPVLRWSIYWPEMEENGMLSIQRGRQTTIRAAKVHAGRVLRVLGCGNLVKRVDGTEDRRVMPPIWREMVDTYNFAIELTSYIPVEYLVGHDGLMKESLVDVMSSDVQVFRLNYSILKVKKIIGKEIPCPFTNGMDKKQILKFMKKQIDLSQPDDLIVELFRCGPLRKKHDKLPFQDT